ncbi:hypothetical protein M427DRAFT_96954 [Gonapodya prolifera JEL478]|uniref:Chloride channel protein n=1 Tax=Gonapodya prolifera (strain JEL478) TaxID=1344416 RepID=A0A139ALC6_GONPJ|nr:hypothetical protein M427DRAFT_96954 [Gonapodya prolifera JEL478]|eukprot:KXS17591.1 hypothetical protein M427DRAFT_96954 [Gonapodya prolifera JEL478]
MEGRSLLTGTGTTNYRTFGGPERSVTSILTDGRPSLEPSFSGNIPRVRHRSRSTHSARPPRRLSGGGQLSFREALRNDPNDSNRTVLQSTSYYDDDRPLRPQRIINPRHSIYSNYENVESGSQQRGAQTLTNAIPVDAPQEPPVNKRVEYMNFVSIDWTNELTRESHRRREFRRLRGCWGSTQRLFYACQAWVLVALIGVIGAVFAAFIDITGDWLSDLKEGFCPDEFYLNKHFCCMASTTDESCPWISWSTFITSQLGVQDEVATYAAAFIPYTAFACLFSSIAAILVKTYAPYAAGSGIPEVKTILGGFVIKKFLGFWTLIVKTIGLALSTASGLNLGKEGPLVHVLCAIGNIASRIFPKFAYNEAKKREILSASCAAGVAFGAPIGGVLFALEEASTYFGPNTMFRSFLCAMTGAFVLRLLNPFRSGKLVLYEVQYTTAWREHDVPFFILLGIFGGVVGALFIHANLRVAQFRRWLKVSQWPVREVFYVTLITAICSYPMVLLRANLGHLVSNLFRECSEVDEEFQDVICSDDVTFSAGSLVIAFVAKILLVTWTFGIRVPSGIFLPPLAIGALAGRALGIAAKYLQETYPDHLLFAACKNVDTEQCISPGLYALVGAAAALGGVTRMTVSLAVIVFELTGVLEYVLPIMIAIMVAKWTGDWLGKESIYEGLITLNSLPYLSPRLDYLHPYQMEDIMTPTSSLCTIHAYGSTVGDLTTMIRSYDFQQFPIVDIDMTLVGIVGARELRYALDEAVKNGATETTPVVFEEEHGGVYLEGTSLSQEPESLDEEAPVNLRNWIDVTPFCVQSIVSVHSVIDYFVKLGLRYSAVTDNGYLKGILTKKDLLRHLVHMEAAEFEQKLFVETDRERKLTARLWNVEGRILD